MIKSGDKNTDSSGGQHITISQDLLENLLVGFIRVRPDGEVVYANRKLRNIAGLDDGDKYHLRDIFPDETNYSQVMENIKRRIASPYADEYKVTITRVSNGRRIPVSILGIPELDADGKVIGSIAWVRPEFTDLVKPIHHELEKGKAPQEVFDCLVKNLHPILPFDSLRISTYNEDSTHVRSLFRNSVISEPYEPQRWWIVSPLVKSLKKSEDALIIPDFEEWLNRPEHRELLSDPGVLHFQKGSPKSCIFLPLEQSGHIYASILLTSCTPNAYDDFDRNLLESIPLPKAVRIIRNLLIQEDMEFRLRLMSEISSCYEHPNDAPQKLADAISTHYGWDHVSVFKVDRVAKEIRLVCQHERPDVERMNEDFHQPINRGVLGLAAKEKRSVNIADVTSEEFRGLYVPSFKEIHSELCIPIVVDGQTHFLLNVEDRRINSFSSEEQKEIEKIVEELARMLVNSESYYILRAVLDSACDGIIRTDDTGIIRKHNLGMTRILGYEDKMNLEGCPIAQLVENRHFEEIDANASEILCEEICLRKKDGSSVSVMLSAATLPKPLGGKVYVLNDLTFRKSMERVEIRGDLYYEVAMQLKPTLSIISSELRRLSSSCKDEKKSILEVLRHLDRMENTFDRLAMFDQRSAVPPFTNMLLSPQEVVKNALLELPSGEEKLTNVSFSDNLPNVHGDLYQLSFSLKSILGYLLRTATTKNPVRISVTAANETLCVTISGYVPEPRLDLVQCYADAEWLASTVKEMALGRSILERFIVNNHGGRLQETKPCKDCVEYKIKLPV